MQRFSRWGTVAAAAALLFTITPPAAHAAPADTAAIADSVSGSIVQVQTTVTASVLMDIDEDEPEWSDPVTASATCIGTVIDDTHILATSECTDPTGTDVALELRKQAGDWYMAKYRIRESLRTIMDALATTADWRVAASASDPTSAPTAEIQVRHVAGPEPQSSPATLVKMSTDATVPFGLFTVSDEFDLDPLPFADDDPALGDSVFQIATSTGDFTSTPPPLTVTAGEVTAKPNNRFKSSSKSVADNNLGGPTLDEDGHLVGVLVDSSRVESVSMTKIRSFVVANDVEPASPTSDDESSIWAWLGPVIGAVALVVIAGGAVAVTRRRRRARQRDSHLAMLSNQQYPAPGPQPMPGQQFPGRQFPGRQPSGRQIPNPPAPPAPTGPQQFGTIPPQPGPPNQSPPAQPGQFDQTQIGGPTFRPPTQP